MDPVPDSPGMDDVSFTWWQKIGAMKQELLISTSEKESDVASTEDPGLYHNNSVFAITVSFQVVTVQI